MARRNWASIGLSLAEGDSYAPWYREALEHAGLSYVEIGVIGFDDLDDYDVLVLAGRSSINPAQQRALGRWIETGGRLVVSGSTWGLDDLLGVKEQPGPGYSRQHLAPPSQSDRLWPDGVGKTLFMGGARVESADAEIVVSTVDDSPAVTRKGKSIFVAPHIGQTLAMMYLGRSVETDAIGPGDGTVHLEDGVLRAEDGTNLSYTEDRETVEGSDTPIFARAHADAVRQIFVRAVYEALELCGKPAFATWHWPENADSVASVSVDCASGPEDIIRLYRSLANYGMPATWTVPVPGMPNDLYRLMRKWGHSPGLLYEPENVRNPLDQLKLHHKQISRGAGSAGVTCVKIKDAKWYGLTDVYDVCERSGAKLSISKGGVQPGSIGFLFGSSHIHYPIAPSGKRSRVAELPFVAFQPGKLTEPVVIQHLIDEVSRHYGCMHMNIELSNANEIELGLQDALMLVRQARMQQYSPDQLGIYERNRRAVTIRPGLEKIGFISEVDFPGFTFMIFGGEHDAVVNGRKYSPNAVRRYGTLFTSFVMNLEQKEHLDLELSVESQAA